MITLGGEESLTSSEPRSLMAHFAPLNRETAVDRFVQKVRS
jgi:hypothetical protein